jgi:hypothetical protein
MYGTLASGQARRSLRAADLAIPDADGGGPSGLHAAAPAVVSGAPRHDLPANGGLFIGWVGRDGFAVGSAPAPRQDVRLFVGAEDPSAAVVDALMARGWVVAERPGSAALLGWVGGDGTGDPLAPDVTDFPDADLDNAP